MKKIYLNLSLLLLTLMAGLSGCSKTDVNPDQPGAKSTTQDAVVTGYMVKAYMFLREPGPFGLGHTALGYEVRELSGSTITKVYTYCGGIENGGGLPFVSPGDNNGGWLNYDLTNNVSMLSRMRSRGYTSYKYVANFSSTSLTNLNKRQQRAAQLPLPRVRGGHQQLRQWRVRRAYGNCCPGHGAPLLQLGSPRPVQQSNRLVGRG